MLLPNTTGILLRRLELGEHDLVLTFFTLAHGKITMVAKYARKSQRRFTGTLELFSEIGMVGYLPKTGGLPILREAWLINAFAGIRGDLENTAYAAYWCELILSWLEEGRAQQAIYQLLTSCLHALEEKKSPAIASIVFQLYFLKFSGLSPDLSGCIGCRKALDEMEGEAHGFDLAKGGLLCKKCILGRRPVATLSTGTIKQLLWLQSNRPGAGQRLRLTSSAVRESLYFLEAFVPYHLGREPKSLKFLHHIRKLSLRGGNAGVSS
jgi:DNA repair protein RecO (recombination protein O)